MKVVDLTGQVFGKLTVVSFAGTSASKRSLWLCRCECGRENTVQAGNLRNGSTKSCGCHKYWGHRRTHGCVGTRLYRVWAGAVGRTTNPKRDNWKYYGGRGISICDEWRDSFEAFRDWALANGYADGLELDRRDNDGDYEPGNCQWLTPEEHKIKHGKRKTR